MTGSVAGVGQFLETVGTPGVQVGQESSVAGQDFATAMQQAGGPSAQEIAGPQDDAVNAAPNGTSPAGANAPSGTQSGSAKTAGAGEATAASQPSRRLTVAGHGQGVALGLVHGAAAGTANAAGSKQTTATLNKPNADEQSVPVPTEVSRGSAQPELISKADKDQKTVFVQAGVPVTAGSSKEVPVTSTAVEAPVKNVVAGAAIKVNGATATAAKTAETASASTSIESKLTAMVPQGTTDVAQPAPPVAATALPGPTVEVMPAAVMDAASASVASDVTVPAAAASTPVTAGVSAVPAKLAGAWTGGAPAASRVVDTASETMGTAAGEPASMKGTPVQSDLPKAVTGTASKTAVSTAAPIVTAPVEPKAAVVMGAPKIAEAVPSSASTAQAAAIQANASQTVAAAGGSIDQATQSVQAALQKTGLAEAPAGKPGVYGGRGTAAALKTAADTVGTDNLNAAQVTAAAQAPRASAVPTPGVTSVASAPVVHRSSGAGNTKPELKAGNAAAAPVQGAPVAAKGTAPVAEVAPDTATAKESGDLGHAGESAQPAVMPAEPGAVVTSVPVAVAHEAGTGAGGGTSTVGAVGSAGAATMTTATHDLAGAAGLTHTTLSSTPTSLEVGVSSSTHGWLKIRAELNAAGEVNASLTGTSTAATEKLRGDLPALTNYLQGERLAVGTLDVRSALHTTLTTSESSATFSQAGSGQGSAGQQGANQGSSQANTGGAAVSADAGSAGDRPQQQGGSAIASASGLGGDEVVSGRGSDAAVYANSLELGDNAGPSPVGYGTGGGWLNVRA